jgi:hypothetical protein
MSILDPEGSARTKGVKEKKNFYKSSKDRYNGMKNQL